MLKLEVRVLITMYYVLFTLARREIANGKLHRIEYDLRRAGTASSIPYLRIQPSLLFDLRIFALFPSTHATRFVILDSLA